MWWVWWLWIAFIVLLILAPVGYGSGYRGWGYPTPTYVRRRTVHREGGQTVVRDELVPADPALGPAPQPSGWGILGDLLWIAIVAAIIWLIVLVWV